MKNIFILTLVLIALGASTVLASYVNDIKISDVEDVYKNVEQQLEKDGYIQIWQKGFSELKWEDQIKPTFKKLYEDIIETSGRYIFSAIPRNLKKINEMTSDEIKGRLLFLKYVACNFNLLFTCPLIKNIMEQFQQRLDISEVNDFKAKIVEIQSQAFEKHWANHDTEVLQFLNCGEEKLFKNLLAAVTRGIKLLNTPLFYLNQSCK